jgi:putative addiction module component (TIGR02574 family)
MVNTTYDEIFGAALALPPGLRAMLAEHLLKSLDSAQQTELDALWADEAEKRVQEVEQGVVTPVPGFQVFQELRSRKSK